MKRIGIVGIGDMGSGIAKNLLKHGFEVQGFDIKPDRMKAFTDMGGIACDRPSDAGKKADACFVVVMTGDQAKQVILGTPDAPGLKDTLPAGSVVILNATIRADEAREIGAALAETPIEMIDNPMSGGFPGAQGGTLTLMSSAKPGVMEKAKPVLEAISSTIHHVGTEPGMGQTVKACLQSILGPMFSACFEAAALAAKAGVPGEVLANVVNTSSGGCTITKTALENIIDRKFEGTGSHINTMYKDLTISMDLAREMGVPLFTTSSAMQLFQAGKTKHPDGDNWVVTRVMEDIAGVELKR